MIDDNILQKNKLYSLFLYKLKEETVLKSEYSIHIIDVIMICTIL